jgi:HKD family nuclease
MTIAQTLIAYSVQSPSQASSVLRAYQQLLKGVSYGRLTGLYAFATLKGARLLVDVLKESVSWKKAKKRWIVSIDDGITEPDALRFLLSFPKSEVRIPYGEQLLNRALTPVFRFHPKTLLLESGTARSIPVGILVGSANLTSSGLCFGHEHVLSMRLPTSGKLMPCIADAIVELEKNDGDGQRY